MQAALDVNEKKREIYLVLNNYPFTLETWKMNKRTHLIYYVFWQNKILHSVIFV